jgi:nucleoside-triphosphatase
MNEINNVLLTGAPSSGKTTVIKEIIKNLNHPANGFYTEEERVDGKRVGFLMKTLDGRSGYLAHQNIKSDFHIRRYGISIENIEKIAIPSITPVENNIIILDEIGKMECFSLAFKQATTNAIDAPNIVIGTITLGGDDFIQEIKKRQDMEISEVTVENRDLLPDIMLKKISTMLNIR